MCVPVRTCAYLCAPVCLCKRRPCMARHSINGRSAKAEQSLRIKFMHIVPVVPVFHSGPSNTPARPPAVIGRMFCIL